MDIKVVDPQLGPTTLTYTPVEIPRIGAGADGVDLGLRTLDEVPYGSIRLLSVFSTPQGGQQAYKVLLFVENQTRPYIVNSFQIQFAEFPIGKGETVLPQLRRFITYLAQKNPSLGIDRGTFEFLSGKPPLVLNKDILILATALAEVLRTIDTSSPPAPEA